jgi:prepilin-type N-terminal cleavage/methylation domain-containing protein
MRPTVDSRLGFENKLIRNPGDRRNAKRCVFARDELLLVRDRMQLCQTCAKPPGRAGARPYRLGFSLIEMLVVVTIIAAIAALITTAVMSALQQQNARVCQNNMLTIEAAKDEYIRDHPGATSIDMNAFAQYFRFGIPKCPDGGTYNNLYVLTQQVICSRHGALQAFPSATP